MNTSRHNLFIPTSRLSNEDIETISKIVGKSAYEIRSHINNVHPLGILVPSGKFIDSHIDLLQAYQREHVHVSGMGEVLLNLVVGMYDN